ncbi:hypothetical protein LH47_01691 [Anoxybacillus thermarum]|uniref:Uncharacterized protein n=1 Tax=Anoxybacillus thermarum TaxID=404937 RepID=A0A0D0Q869_9BACL|nr:hypothetical protein LH47_01691 [Anoxybacillus thermarum]
MSLSSLRHEARKALKGKWGSAVLLMLVYALVTMVVPFGVEVVFSGGWKAWLDQETVPASASIVSMFVSFALIPLSVVLYWVFFAMSLFVSLRYLLFIKTEN